MSNHRIKLIAAFSAIAWCLGTTTALANDTTSKTHANPYEQPAAASTAWTGGSELRMASDSLEGKSVHDCHGMKVTGSDGQELGQIEDFVIDTQTGKVVYAVVSSSGPDGSSGALRLVQQSSIQSSNGDALTAQIDREAFDALPVYSKQDLESDHISILSQESQDISDPANQQAASSALSTSDPLGSTTAGATTPDSTYSATSSDDAAPPAITEPQTVTAAPGSSPALDTASQTATHLVLASKFSGKEVRAGDESVGTIEQVALDLDEGTATAVLKTNTEFAGTESKFHVPFSKLELDSSGADAVSTTLARSDFAQAQSSSSSGISTSGTTTSAATTSTDESLSATGRTDMPSTASTDPYSAGSSATASTTHPSSDPASADPGVAGAGSSTSTATDTTSSAYFVDTSSSSTASSTDTTAGASSYDPDRARSGAGIAGTTTPSSTDTGVSSSDTSVTSAQPDISSDPGTSTAAGTSTSPSITSDTTAAAEATDEYLTPTGRETGASRQYALSSAAASIRTALDNDQSLTGEDIRVQEAGRKIMLQGKVSDEETKERIEALAKSAAGSVEVENKLKVEKQR